ncbi:hypothetical protein PF005_g8596 [Phytophthora fragariae]|uniref:Uncharacterized protein n=1 Tax=Phytophthora fragariae TaxID=53985 RepID=A0A6A3KBJ3_9STRA|nr:hypothetical protein PF003_g28387 [Phytophthora fragariae]KAE8941651.1 hypothetical protein PF009_g8565 [Phytophthora fragariae]KAE9004950.1 hypothetical protein PF011_g12241 [Phytophthora fragariae]KAE9105463.1 hypothetical protein PF010_g13011 [Phytophthora fragariae]KAE9110344.1 hypothetical protein PF007_g11890 [Phytophthora fragariae]
MDIPRPSIPTSTGLTIATSDTATSLQPDASNQSKGGQESPCPVVAAAAMAEVRTCRGEDIGSDQNNGAVSSREETRAFPHRDAGNQNKHSLGQEEETKAEDPDRGTYTAGSAASGSVPAREEAVAEHVFELKELKPNMPPPWAFIARVVAKNPVREWKTWQDAGTLLEVYVADILHGCTRVTIFNEFVDRYESIVTPGTTCYFSGGRVKREFSSSNNIELSCRSGSDIHRVPDIPVVPQLLTVRLGELAGLADGSTATTIAVVHALGGLKRLLRAVPNWITAHDTRSGLGY